MADNSTDLVPRSVAIWAAWTWRILIIGVGALIVALALYELRVATLPIFIAILLTTLLLPPVHFLRRRGLSSGLATAIVFLSSIAIIVGLVLLTSSTVSEQFSQFGPQINKAIDTVNNWLRTGPLQLSDDQISKYIDQASNSLRENSSSLSSGLVTSATLIGEVLVGIIVALVLTFYFTKDGEYMSDSIINVFPERHRGAMHAGAHQAFATLANYLRGVAMTGLVDGVLIGIALLIIGVPLVIPLVLLTFFGAFFPVVGATLAGLFAASIALVNGGIGDAIWVIVAVLIVQQAESHLLQPLLVGRAVALHPAVIIVTLIVGSIVAGIIGAFIAVPLTAVVVAVVRAVRAHRAGEPVPDPVPAT